MASDGLCLRVLGSVGLGEDRDVAHLSGRLRRLLAGLLAAGGSVVSVDRLTDVVWGDSQPDDPEAALHNLVARLRARLREASSDDADSAVALVTRSPGYLLQVPTAALDATRFESLAGAARELLPTEPHEAEEAFTEALGLWRGPAYAEFADEDFARPEAVRLEELRLGTEEDRIEAALLSGHHSAASAELEALVAREPLRERRHRQLMVALYRSGRQGDALGVSRAFRERMVEELGLDPTPELQRLEARLLRQDAELEPPPAPVASRSAPAADPPTRGVPPPGAAGDLFGREDFLTELIDALQPGRLVTLTGPGGVGKTSLAREAAAQVRSRFTDADVMVELATVSSSDDVTAAVSTALRLPPRSDVDSLDQIAEHLTGQQRLVVLDNCEHVLDSVAELAEVLLRSCAGVAVLATSRAPLEVAGERTWVVPTLPTPPAGVADPDLVAQAPSVRLFVERAAARDHTFVLDDHNAEQVAEVCRRLDGLPLALELAAARMGAMTPADLVNLLSWRFRLLHGGRRSPERHRTLRSLVDWSYDMLDPPAQRAFDVFSVFAGSFTLDEADRLLAATPRMTGTSGAGAELALSLVDRSMLTVASSEPTTRYVLLETLRAYGRERLDADEQATDVRRAHAEIFTALAEEANRHLFQPGHVAAVERVGAAIDELRAAWTWALDHDLDVAIRLVGNLAILVEHRMPAEVADWADRTIIAADQGTTAPGLANVLAVAGAAARFGGDLARARQLLERGLGLGADPATEGLLRYVLAEVSLFEGRLPEVDEMVAEILALGPVPVAPMAHVMRPLSAAYGGDLDLAGRLAEEQYDEARRAGDDALLGWKTFVLGEVSIDTDPERARSLLLDALAEARRIDDRYLRGVALVAAAALHSRHGGAADAVPLFLDVIEHWRGLGDWLHQWTTIRNVVDLLIRCGRLEDAALLHAALSARTETFPIFGEDAERMAAAAEQLSAALGGAAFAELAVQGGQLGDTEVLDVGRRALTELAEAPVAQD